MRIKRKTPTVLMRMGVFLCAGADCAGIVNFSRTPSGAIYQFGVANIGGIREWTLYEVYLIPSGGGDTKPVGIFLMATADAIIKDKMQSDDDDDDDIPPTFYLAFDLNDGDNAMGFWRL